MLAVGGASVVFRAFDRPVCPASSCSPDFVVLVPGLLVLVAGGLLLYDTQ